jgi:HlyD family secretion protein
LKERQVAAGSRLQRMLVKAPITGTIYDMSTNTIGGVIAPGEVVMLIAPEDDDLVLQAQISPNDVDQVQQGQQARVRFSAFNSNQTPEIMAVVEQVAADTSRPDAQAQPFYAVRLTIPAEEVEKLGGKQLRPGMMAETFIQTEARSPLAYLLKPLYDMLPRAMTES